MARAVTRCLLLGSVALTAAGVSALSKGPAPPQSGPWAARSLRSLLPPFRITQLNFPPPSDTRYGPPQLSPHGGYIAATYRPDREDPMGPASVRVHSAAGEYIFDLTAGHFPRATFVWGRTDAEIILSATDQRGDHGYYTIDPRRQVFQPSGHGALPFFAPNKRDYVARLEDGFRRVRDGVPQDPAIEGSTPRWSPDGSRYALTTALPRPSTAREVRVVVLPEGIQRMVLARADWHTELARRGWAGGSGPADVAWSPRGDALFGVVHGRRAEVDEHLIWRLDPRGGTRKAAPVDEDTQFISASRNWKRWIIRSEGRYWGLDF